MMQFSFKLVFILIFTQTLVLKNSVIFAANQEPELFADYLLKQNCYNSTDGLIKYRDEGRGEVIILLHGVPTSGWMYRNVMQDLSSKGFRVIVPDMLGFGASDSPMGKGIYEPSQHAKRLLELIQILGVKKCTFVTDGDGSLWIADIIEKHPELVKRLILINPLLNAKGLTKTQNITTGFAANLKKKMFNLNCVSKGYLKKIIKQGMTSNELGLIEKSGYEFAIEAGKTEGIIAHYAYLSSTEFNNEFSYPILTQPILFIKSEELISINWEAQIAALKIPPSSSLDQTKILNGGNLLPEDLPEAISKLIEGFVGGR